jgi:hypothetical protein
VGEVVGDGRSRGEVGVGEAEVFGANVSGSTGAELPCEHAVIDRGDPVKLGAGLRYQHPGTL